MREKILEHEEEIEAGYGSISYPVNSVKIEKMQFSLYELKRKYDASYRKIVLDSDFQRNNVWNNRAKIELIESILMNLPLPAFYFAQDSIGRLIVVDGRQRLSSAFDFMNDVFSLKGLKILKEFEGLKFSELKAVFQNRIEDTQILAYTVMPETPEHIKFDIFDRVNRTGVKLNKQEMRNALYQGQVTALLKELVESDSFLNATGFALKNDNRMKDRYLVSRFITLYLYCTRKLTDEYGKQYRYKGDIDDFIATAYKWINKALIPSYTEIKEETLWSLNKSYEILGPDAFRLPYVDKKTPINMNVFETIMLIMCNSKLSLSQMKEDKERYAGRVIDFLNSDEFRTNIGNHRDSQANLEWRLQKAVEIGRSL